MISAYLTMIGLILDVSGVLVIAWGIVATKDKIKQEVASQLFAVWAGTDQENEEYAIKSPLFHSRMRENMSAIWGAVALVFGFVFQFIGAWFSMP